MRDYRFLKNRSTIKRNVSNDGGPASLTDFAHWRFEPSGDYSIDCEAGKRLAARFLELREDDTFEIELSNAVRAIHMKDRPHSGIEVGFFAGISIALQGGEPYRHRGVTVIRGGQS